MTDGNTARYRSNEPFSSRAAGPDGHGSDPLAELARLIGQSDPFATQGREPVAPAEVRYDDPAPQPELPLSEARDPYRENDAEHLDRMPLDRVPYDDRGSYDLRHDTALPPDPVPPPGSGADQPPEWFNPSPVTFDPFAPPSSRAPVGLDPANLRLDVAAEPPPAFLSEFKFPTVPPQRSAHDAPPDLHAAPDLQPGPRVASPGASMPPFLTDGSLMPPPNTDEYYDDAPQGGRRKGLLTVAAVLCLAVVGTAGAFGYRTWTSGTTAKSPPPVIRASAEPNKVAPPPAADASANKISYDRFADRGQNEKVVVREEKPVDLKDVTRGNAPARTTAPAAAANSVFPTPSAPNASAAVPGNPPSVLTEPKRVRTVPIRPDGAETSARAQIPQMASPVPAVPAQPAQPMRQAAVAPVPPAANAPMNLSNPASSPQPQVRAPATRPASSQPASGNAPLSLSPDANLPPPPAAAPVRSAPTRVAAAPAAGNGSYLVQVSSQRSEADAQAAFRNLQSRYSGVLGDRQAVIRRADLAGRGTYYRAMVGPFATRDQAVQLCSSLKAAGGDCVVQAN